MIQRFGLYKPLNELNFHLPGVSKSLVQDLEPEELVSPTTTTCDPGLGNMIAREQVHF